MDSDAIVASYTEPSTAAQAALKQAHRATGASIDAEARALFTGQPPTESALCRDTADHEVKVRNFASAVIHAELAERYPQASPDTVWAAAHRVVAIAADVQAQHDAAFDVQKNGLPAQPPPPPTA